MRCEPKRIKTPGRAFRRGRIVNAGGFSGMIKNPPPARRRGRRRASPTSHRRPVPKPAGRPPPHPRPATGRLLPGLAHRKTPHAPPRPTPPVALASPTAIDRRGARGGAPTAPSPPPRAPASPRRSPSPLPPLSTGGTGRGSLFPLPTTGPGPPPRLGHAFGARACSLALTRTSLFLF